MTERPGSEITWNDHIPDPDNPVQQRQIDITIRREGASTLIECRIHKNPQDVSWIEELIGRRISLRADAVIAVSYSGFTKGAIEKSKRYGIILRDFQTLTEEEITKWGYKTRVIVSYHNFSNLNLSFLFSRAAKGHISREQILNYLTIEANFIAILELIVKKIDDKNPELFAEKKINFLKVQLYPKNDKVAGFQIKELWFHAKYRFDRPRGARTFCSGLRWPRGGCIRTYSNNREG